ncbi:MAG: SDR family NAD(P)-dependent oxidoreductase [Actinomycetota bacterium]|nr:SDR family NAD(P)-dependent oxidoreductase [Actinomycetota bacterium]
MAGPTENPDRERTEGRRPNRKRALLTGASSGIGIATAEKLADSGYDLALVARGEGLEVAADRVRRSGGTAHVFRTDVSDLAMLEETVQQALADLGGLDLAVFNAGVGIWGTFDETEREDFNRVLDVTFTAAVDATRLVLTALEESGGAIVYTGSVAGQMPIPMMAPYSAAKHALRGFAGALRGELRARKSPVRISMVNPGPIDTPFWKNAALPAGRGESTPPPFVTYDVAAVATEIVRVAESPRREVTVGGSVKAFRLAYLAGGALAEAAVGRLMLGLGKSDDSPREPRGLTGARGKGMTGGGRAGRPSLLAVSHHVRRQIRRKLATGA